MEAEPFEKVPVLGAALELGWEPRVGLDELILETARYYASRTRRAKTTAGCASWGPMPL